MTAAAARKIRIEEPTTDVAPEKRTNGLWIDRDTLPTTLAQIGKKKELTPLKRWTDEPEDSPRNRILEYADMVLGTTKERRRRVRKKK